MRGLRLISLLLATAFVAAAFVAPAFRAPDGALTGRFVVPFAAAFAFVLLAAFGTPARRAALLWAALAIIGHAVTLQLVHAGSEIGYQHYVPGSQLLASGNAPWTALLLIQTLIVAIGLRPVLSSLRSWSAEHLPGWRLPAVAVLFALGSTALSRDVSRYAFELGLATFAQLVALATAFLAIRSLPAQDAQALGRRIDAWLGGTVPDEGRRMRLDRFVLLAALWAVAVAALLNVLAYQRHPHLPDDVVYLLHARYFARGMLTMPLPPVPEAFDLDLMTYEATRWYSPVPPGWPAVLSVGALLGVPWMVNPVLSGLAVILTYLLLQDLHGLRLARIATLLLCASPWFLFMGMSFMTHQVTLVAALGAAVCAAILRRGGALGWAVPAGIGLGLVALGRPLEGVIVAVPLALWVLGAGFRSRTVAVTAMAVSSMATTAIALPYNEYLTGSATRFPIMAYTDAVYGAGTNAMGFGANRGLGWSGLDPYPGHGWRDVLVNANLNIAQVNVELFGWAIGSLLPIVLLLFLRRVRRQDAWMLAAVAANVGLHSLYWFSGGPDFGARYWYLILVPCVALAASGIVALGASLRDATGETRVLLAAALLCASTLVAFVPWRAADKYHDYRGMKPDIRTLAREHEFGRSLVLVRGRRHPDYASAAAYNPIDLHADAPIFAWDRSDEVRLRVLEAYRDRVVWIVDGPTVTGDTYRIVAGPVPAETLIREAAGGR